MTITEVSIENLVKYMPEKSEPVFVAADGKYNCGFNTKPRLIAVYMTPKDYFSISPIKKQSEIITIENTRQNVWIVNLRHFLFTIATGVFDNSYYLYENNRDNLWFKEMTQGQRLLLSDFIQYGNCVIPYATAASLCLNFAKKTENFTKMGQKEKKLEYLLHSMRTLLYCERLLRNDKFPHPDINRLKSGHKFEKQINAMLKCNAENEFVQPYQYTEWDEMVTDFLLNLKKLSLTPNIYKYTHADAVNKGNKFFLSFMGDEKLERTK